MPPRVDLHSHSTASDGRLSPAALVALAVARGIGALALTDHDTTAGIAEARAAAPPGFELVPGLEINSSGDRELSEHDIDFLGYFVDPDDPALQARLALIRDARRGRAYGMVARLAELGVPVHWERVLAIAGDADSIARPHVARALLEAGHVASLAEAFERFIGDDGPAYVDRLRATAREAIDLIHAAGGVAVIAHPHHAGVAGLIPALAERGLDGVEAYYPAHSPAQQADLLATAHRYGLLVTGGSDFHDPAIVDDTHGGLGSQSIPWDVFEELRTRAGR
jgi:predicted metal-dependent phosphoesterase TrpH